MAYDYDFRDEVWGHITMAAQDFIASLFVSPDQRPDAEACLEHPWFNGDGDTKQSRRVTITNFGGRLAQNIMSSLRSSSFLQHSDSSSECIYSDDSSSSDTSSDYSGESSEGSL